MPDQQLATADQANAPDITATLATRRSLTLPAFPVAAAPPTAVPPPGSASAAPSNTLDLPRPKPLTTEYLRRFPLIPSRPLVNDEHSCSTAAPQPVAPPRETPAPQRTAPTRPKRVLLPAAPAEPQAIVTQEVRALAGPPLTGEASIIDRRLPAPAPIPTVAPTMSSRTPRARR